MDKKSAIKKIKKCLRLAKSANEHEAAQALKHAQALMREYGVCDADIELSAIEEYGVRVPNVCPKWQYALFNVVCSAFGVRGYILADWEDSSKVSHFRFYGVSPRPELASYAYEVLLRQLRAARREYMGTVLKHLGSSKNKTYRADMFSFGWVYEVNKKVAEFAVPSAEQVLLDLYRKNLGDLQTAKPRNVAVSGRLKASGEMDLYRGAMAGKKAQLNHAMNGNGSELKKLEA